MGERKSHTRLVRFPIARVVDHEFRFESIVQPSSTPSADCAYKVSMVRMVRRVGSIVAVLAAGLVAGCGGNNVTVAGKPADAPHEPSAGSVYRVPSGSMEPTLRVGARVVISSGTPQLGDIVVFNPPEGAELEICGPRGHMVTPGGPACAHPGPTRSTVKFIKRIVAGPGDTLYISEGHIYRNDKRESDPYIRPCGSQQPTCNFRVPIKIPSGHWFLIGDNRGESDDSRFWGPVPTDWITGIVRLNTPAGSR